MGLFDKKISNTTNVDQDFTDYNLPFGQEGTGNYGLGPGASDTSFNYGVTPAIGGVGGDVFAPTFSFLDSGNSSNDAAAAARAVYNQEKGGTGENDSTFLDWWSANGDRSGVNSLQENPYDYALLQALAPSNPQAAEILNKLGGSSGSGGGNSGAYGAALNITGDNSVGAGRDISGPVAAGDDSVAVQLSGGGFVNTGEITGPLSTGNVGGNQTQVGGDNSGQIINAPTSGPIIGGDVDAPVITAPIGGPATFGENSPVIQISAPPASSNADSGVAPSVTAPVATGDDSVAQAATGGGVVVNGDTSAPISTGDIAGTNIQAGGDISAPISSGNTGTLVQAGGDIGGPVVNSNPGSGGVSTPITAGGDIEQTGNVILGNSGTINISTDTPEIVNAALDANRAALTAALNSNADAIARSLASTDKSLAALAETRTDPNVTTNADAMKAVAVVAVAFVAIALLNGRRAA